MFALCLFAYVCFCRHTCISGTDPGFIGGGDNEVCMEAKPLSEVQERIEPLVGCQGEAPLELKIFQ